MAVAAAALGCRPDDGKRTGDPAPAPAPQPGVKPPAGPAVEISILYGSEKKTWLEEQIKAFDASGAKLPDGRAIHVTGKPIGSGEAMAAILDGSETPDGVQPRVGRVRHAARSGLAVARQPHQADRAGRASRSCCRRS